MAATERGGPFYRPRRSAADALAGGPAYAALAGEEAAFHAPPQNQQPLPTPTGQPPYRLELSSVIRADAVAAIEQRGPLTFHTVGDTGGVKASEAQEIVTMWMEHDFRAVDPPPAFFYHLGDGGYFDAA